MKKAKEEREENSVIAARCHEIQVSLGAHEVPEFENIPEIGMAVRLSLHIRGLPLIDYHILRSVASYILGIPSLALERILRLLAEVEFISLQTEGTTIKGVLPKVPYYEDIYLKLGEFAESERSFNEHEQLALEILGRLAKSPEVSDSLRDKLNAENKAFDRIVSVGTKGSFLIERRSRGKDVLLSPTYFSENSEIFADAVAGSGGTMVRQVMEALRSYQGWPLKMIEGQAKIGNIPLAKDQINLLKRLAQDGAIKPPSIETKHSGKNHFLFTPTPTGAALSPNKREVYEKAMAIVAAVRQGQLLPQKYAIRSPGALLYVLRRDLHLSRATTEATQQYKKLVHLRIGRLIDAGGGFAEFHIIDQPENREALDIAYGLVSGGTNLQMEIDDQARMALQQDQSYIDSLVSAGELRKHEPIPLTQEAQMELDFIMLGGSKVR